jgi:putative ABC transport system permease protein
MNMTLVAGRGFEDGVPDQGGLVINEEAAERLGFRSPAEAIGGKVTFSVKGDGQPSSIIGVLKNFYQRSPKEEHIPMAFYHADWASYYTVALQSSNMNEALARMKNVWNKVYPDQLFHYFFVDEQFNNQYQADRQFGNIIAALSGLAVFIACLGLFGLSSFTIARRTREIGIRKVLGASVGQIVRLLTQDFARVIILAGVIALPFAWFAINSWLSTFAKRISFSVWILAAPVMIILLLSLSTVIFQTIRSALINPTETLKEN